MKIAIIGYGKMGKAVEKAALEKQLSIAAKIAPSLPTKTMSKESLQHADVCIDFTHPDAVLANIKKAAELKKNIVVGTTGWYERLDAVKTLVDSSGIGLLYAPNFSLGVNLFLRIVKEAAQLIAPFDAYDAAGHEVHHNQKADIPSGTAIAIANTMLNALPQKKRACFGNEPFARDASLLHFSSLRCGSVPGTHTVTFSSPIDSITLTHEAHSREGFAIGALTAAEWLHGKKGLFTIDDLINTLRDKT